MSRAKFGHKTKTKHPKGALVGKTPLKEEYKIYNKHSRVTIWTFNCLGYKCNNIVRIQKHAIYRHTGMCSSCCQRGRPFEAMYNELFNRKERHGKEVTLSYEEFLEFTKIEQCHYCLDEIKWVPFTKDGHGNDLKDGRSYKLDRKNNNIGYTKDNCVVCCWTCNSAKGSRYTYDQFHTMTASFRNKNLEDRKRLKQIFYNTFSSVNQHLYDCGDFSLDDYFFD